MKQNFETCLSYVLIDEGGNDDDPRDHGGRTSRGITQREYDSWCRLNNKAGGDVWKATNADVKKIYHDQYWNPYCDALPAGLDYLYFDIAVNAGRSRATKTFQKALGVSTDGMMGQVTLDAVNSTSDIPAMVKKISEVRRQFYRNLSQFPIYGKGWLRRVDHCESGSLSLTQKGDYEHRDGQFKSPKVDGDQKPAGTTVSPETTGATATAGGGLLATLHQWQEQLAAYKDTIKYVEYVLLALITFGFGYTLWGMWKKRQVDKAML